MYCIDVRGSIKLYLLYPEKGLIIDTKISYSLIN